MNTEISESIKKKKTEKPKEMKPIKKGLSTTRQIIFGFLLAIIVGTVLLSLPISVVDGEVDILTSLFTATTSVCVTGLVVVDTFAHWTIFGKLVILMLIQLGGLGVVAFTSFLMLMLRKKVTLKDRMVIQDAYNLNSMKGMVRFIRKIIAGTLCVECFGMLLYCIKFIPQFGFAKGLWFSVFNSVSAFCNAGMDIIGPYSLMNYFDSPLVLFTTMFLIFSGGIGFIVWWDVIDVLKDIVKKKISIRDFFSNLKTHTRIVLSMTLALILTGMVLIFIFEYNNDSTIGNMSLGDKLMNSLFQSVTLRTAGFASFNQGGLSEASVLVSVFLMLIGGSPVGTAGGIKTVTFAVLLFTIISVVKGRKETVIFNKSINGPLVRKSISVALISFGAFMLVSIILMVSNHFSLTDSIFEVASAVGTVGLSRGITADLDSFGRVLIVISMYLGRIGPISMFVAFNNNYTIKNSIHYAEADIIVG